MVYYLKYGLFPARKVKGNTHLGNIVMPQMEAFLYYSNRIIPVHQFQLHGLIPSFVAWKHSLETYWPNRRSLLSFLSSSSNYKPSYLLQQTARWSITFVSVPIPRRLLRYLWQTHLPPSHGPLQYTPF